MRRYDYVSSKKDGTERLNFTIFYEALVVGKAYTAQLGLQPGDECGIKFGCKQIQLQILESSIDKSHWSGSRQVDTEIASLTQPGTGSVDDVVIGKPAMKKVRLVRILGGLAACFVLADLAVYLREENIRSVQREEARRLACYDTPSARGCEREAAEVKQRRQELEEVARQQRRQEEERLAAEAQRQEVIERMTPTCAAIAMQHYNMRTTLNGDYLLSNQNWHNAGCRELFGAIRNNSIRNHPTLPANWAGLDFDNAFPKKCWWVNGGDLAPCRNTS